MSGFPGKTKDITLRDIISFSHQTKMKKLINKAREGFTLVELIVVIAIVAILSTVGFVSYTGYITNSRNTVRVSDLAEASNVVTQFIATNGRTPDCESGQFCEFREDDGDASAPYGIDTADWALLNVQSTPTDPRQASGGGDIFYILGEDGSDFQVAATEENDTGELALISGSNPTTGLITGTDAATPDATVNDCDDDVAGSGDGLGGTATLVVAGTACVPYNF